MLERMWFNNPRDKEVKRRSNLSLGHEVTLVKDQCRLDIKKYSFS